MEKKVLPVQSSKNTIYWVLHILTFVTFFSLSLYRVVQQEYFAAILNFLWCTVTGISGIVLLSPGSRFRPRIEISQKGIYYKPGLFERSLFLNWDDIDDVEVSAYCLTINKRDHHKEFFYFEGDAATVKSTEHYLQNLSTKEMA